MDRSQATYDAYAGIETELAGEPVTLPALTFADGLRLMRLAERAGAGDDRAAAEIVATFPRAVGLALDELSEDDFARIFARCFDPGQWDAPVANEEPTADSDSPDLTSPNFDDAVADYAAAYGGIPSPNTPWPLVIALMTRTVRYESRGRLRLLDSMTSAIAGAFGAGKEVEAQRDRLIRGAYPDEAKPEKKFTENTLNEEPST